MVQNLFTFLVYLRVESCAVVHNNRLFYDKIFVLEIPPVFIKEPESPLDCQHVFHGHTEFEVLNKETNLVSPIDGEFTLVRSRSDFTQSLAIFFIFISFSTICSFTVIYRLLRFNIVIFIIILIKEVLFLL